MGCGRYTEDSVCTGQEALAREVDRAGIEW